MSDQGQEMEAGPASSPLVHSLRDVLLDLYQHQYPIVPNPPGLDKRASVALIIRISPRYAHWPTRAGPTDYVPGSAKHDTDGVKRIDRFFDQQWVDEGDPEVLFIKRASRQGDPWTGHVALPGGRRDPEDEDDRAAAIRETREEVGLELSDENSIAIGNLPQRVVTTGWGKVPIMVLCPYIFLLIRHDLPPLKLQPTEVASTNWVPLKALLSPSMRTYEYQDVSARFAKKARGVKRWAYQALLGHMMFSAVRLLPSESIQSSHGVDLAIDGAPASDSVVERVRSFVRPDHRLFPHMQPLLLWGLTLGVMADLLELLPPHNALSLWTYPTFSPPDLRFVVWLLSYNFRKRKARELPYVHVSKPATIENGLDSVPIPREKPTESREDVPETGINGIGVNHYYQGPDRKWVGSRSSRVGFMLDGYYELIGRSVWLTFTARVALLSTMIWWSMRMYRKE